MTEREASKKMYRLLGERPNTDELKSGNLARIADACELMAKDRQDLLNRIKELHSYNEAMENVVKSFKKENISLRGWNTRLRNKLEKQKSIDPLKLAAN